MIACPSLLRTAICVSILWVAAALSHPAWSAELSGVTVGPAEQVVDHTKLVIQAVRSGDETLGRLLQERFRLASVSAKPHDVVKRLQESLDPVCLLSVGINPESRVKVASGSAKLELERDRWRYFLVKVINEAGVTAPLRFTSEQRITDRDPKSRDRWLEIESFQGGLLPAELSGVKLQYQIIRLRAHETGKRAAVIAADVGQGTADIGFRNDVLLTFTCQATRQQSPKSRRGNLGKTSDQRSVQGIVIDEDTSLPIPARVHIQSDDGEWHLVQSDGGTQVHYDRNQANVPNCPEVHTTLSADPFVASLTPGKYTFRVERGKEYLPVVREVEITEEPQSLEFRLKRWINMADKGWYSGDTHVHRSIDELPNVMQAEDLNVAFPLTYWVTKSDIPATNANGDSKYVSGGLIQVDPTHVIQPINSEYEIFTVAGKKRTLGALLALNHRKPFTVGVPPVGELARQARRQGALLDLDKHSWPWSLMLVPVMDVDLFQLSNNHVWQSGFGFSDWTIDKLPPFMHVETTSEGFTEAGWLDFGFQTYYMMLNCGFRMRVSAGTASGVHPVPLGFSRVYVHLPDGFDYDQWVAELDAGHSFVTNGPMVTATFNDQPPGSTFRSAAEPTTLTIRAHADSRRPLERIEIVVNGRVQHIIQPRNRPGAQGGYTSEVDHEMRFEQSAWVALRCFESHPKGRVRFAHTNPVYVDIEDKPLLPRKLEVDYLIRRMQEEIELNGEVLNAGALQEYRRAMEIYQKLAERAK